MSFVGKILVVVQLVLSVLFMALAGAVFATHQNWKGKFEQQAIALAGAQKSVTDTLAEKETALSLSQKLVDENKATLGTLTNQVQNQTTELNALKEQNNETQQKLQTQTALALTKAKESDFRTTESEEQRAANRALQISLDETSAKMRQLEDDKFALQIEYDNLKDQLLADQVTMAYYKKMLILHKIETDPLLAEKRNAAPPPVDGLVKVVKIDRTNRPVFVEITIGSDDGLLTGHVLDVIRLGVDGKKPQYLGKIRVTSVSPDVAVCEVMRDDQPANGIIQEGDNVTTKL
jgi:hypothetical protein